MPTQHATTIAISEYGFAILGHSGAGKTTTALALIEKFKALGHFAAFIADDRTLFSNHHGALIAKSPENIKGQAELRGFGIIQVPTILSAKINCVIELTNEPIQRLPQNQNIEILGISLPLIRANSTAQALSLVEAFIMCKK